MLKKSAFTLIELSIVLVIIGLIAGGVLVGQDLIKTAQLRKVLKTIDNLESAVNAFKLKYNCFPGDCADAIALGLSVDDGLPVTYGTGAGRGNGNGYIDGGGMEGFYFFTNLHHAGLFYSDIEAGGTDFKFYGGLKIYKDSLLTNVGSNYNSTGLYFAIALQGNGLVPCAADYCPSLSPFEAYYIDQKRDDGLPLTGNVLAGGPFTDMFDPVPTNPPSTGAAGSANCVSNSVSPSGYNLTNSETNMCAIRVSAR